MTVAAPPLFKLTVTAGTTVSDGTGGTTLFPETLTFEGDTLVKSGGLIPANSTRTFRVAFPTDGDDAEDRPLVQGIIMGAVGAALTVLTNDDDEDSSQQDTVALVKSRPLVYYPGGPVANPFAHHVGHFSVHNPDLTNPAAFHLRAVYNAQDPAV
jgi:hypothetical protein